MSETPPLAAQDPTFEGWEGLSWRERRARRLRRWIGALGVEFEHDSNKEAYRERIQLFIDVLRLLKPDRVPVLPLMGFYPARYGCVSPKEAMHDYEKLAAAQIAFYEQFQPDFQSQPVAPGTVFDRLGLEFVEWPGHGVSEHTPWQYVEAEYMKADEYDALIKDPSDYFRGTFLPRIGSAFAPLARLESFANMMEASTLPFNILPFADPSILEAVQRLADAAQETLRYLKATGAANVHAAARLGIPPLVAGTAKAPYDVLADTLRGTRGIATDRFHQPDKIIEAAERLTPLMVDWAVDQAAGTDAPVVMFALHKGADGFMSDAEFRKFYWPTLKAVMRGLINQGLVPLMSAEGSYDSRLEAIVDEEIPAESVIWLFDQTDMAAAKRALGGYACVAGNVPTSLLAGGSAEDAEGYVTRLLEQCAGDGGFMLMSGSVVDDAKPETLQAMIETGRTWKG
ncbi:MAG: uroporphyrinogen decarboxylase [Actinobacteria bacterium]|nr:uroporphyrinogen decarboxylase [Actinomycetota bacterium]